MEYKIISLAREIIAREPSRRPEAEWIQQRVNRLAEQEGIKSRAEADQLIYEKMYARAPKKSDTTKIRYWRTGYHLPTSRKEALVFAGVLQLDQKETLYFLQAYMEKSDLLFETPPAPTEPVYSRYRERTDLMEDMLSEYISSVSPARMFQLDIPYEELGAYIRHLYCIDALSATAFAESLGHQKIIGEHLTSSNYESEFLRIRKLLGEIPRRTILRHILLLGIPYLNRRLVDERLSGLGYLPLTEGHTSPRGALVDDLVIGLLELYEDACGGESPLTCRDWLLTQLSLLDRYLLDCKREEYRFLFFRILSSMADYGK